MIEFVNSEVSIIDILYRYPGYKFKLRGNITKDRLYIWVNTVLNRLIQEGILLKCDEYKIYVVKGYKMLRNNNRLDRGLISISDMATRINTLKIYIIFNRINNEFNYRYVMPDILDCKVTDSLFRNGKYIGYDITDNNINTYTKI